jgi:tetratricopeptide (TPR) repeat protein
MTGPRRPHIRGHLSLQALAELVMAARGSQTVDRALRHLLAQCRICRRGSDALRRLTRDAHHPDYVIVLAEAREAPTLWRQLGALPYPSQLAAVETDESYQRWGLCRLLQRLSGEAARRDPESAGRLANLAVRIPPFLEPAYHIDSICDLQALSLCYLGNAWRALREPHGAADAFDAARALLLAGTGDPAVTAEALALEARLLRDRRELAQAAALLDRVEAIYVAAGGLGEGAEGAVLDDGDPERAAKARLHRAWCFYHLGRVDEARGLLERTAEQLDARRHPRSAMAVRSGLAWCAISLAAPDTEARLAAAIQLASQVGDDADRLRLRRAETRADLATGERGLAEQSLRAAAAGFIERDLGVDAALSFLDLAALYLREGAEQPIFRQLSADLLPVFFHPEVGRQAMAFLLWFQQSCESGKLTPGIIASVAEAVEGQRQPSLAWWSAPQIPSKEGTGDAGATALG